MRVMTYNILNGGKGREAYILDVIQTETPDLVVLQEVYDEDILIFLSQHLGMSHYIGTGNNKRKVALLSKYPVLSFKSHHIFPPVWRNFIDAKIEYESNKTIRIIGIHPMANLGVVFELWRFWEASYVLNHTQNYQSEYCLIAGDFNAIAPREKVKVETMPNWLKWIVYLQGNRVYHFSIARFLSAGFSDCFRSLNSEDGFTLPPSTPNARLDYILVNTKLKTHLRSCWVSQNLQSANLASDHFPVMAEFNL